jgi:hypothetical protein
MRSSLVKAVGAALLCGGCAGEAPAPKAAELLPPTSAPAPAEAAAVVDAGIDAAPADAVAPNWNDEFAWARQRWQKELAGVELESPVATLIAWVPADKPLEVWVSAVAVACRPGSLARQADEADELSLTIVLDENKKAGVRRRSISTASVGQRLGLGRSSQEEELATDGSWVVVGASAASGIIRYRALSSVTADAARFDGQWLEVRAECPTEQLPCGDGGFHSCTTCNTLDLEVVPANPFNRNRSAKLHLSSCSQPCPPRVDNPDLQRMTRLFSAIEPYRVQTDGPAARAGIYRSLAACRAGTKPAKQK